MRMDAVVLPALSVGQYSTITALRESNLVCAGAAVASRDTIADASTTIDACWVPHTSGCLVDLLSVLIEVCLVPQGLLLPLCQAGNCTLREAVIFGSVLKRVSLPVLHSAAALLRIAEMEWSGTNSWFIRVLLDKKYALPYRVVSFMSLQGAARSLARHPILSHSYMCVVCSLAPHACLQELLLPAAAAVVWSEGPCGLVWVLSPRWMQCCLRETCRPMPVVDTCTCLRLQRYHSTQPSTARGTPHMPLIRDSVLDVNPIHSPN